MTEAPVRWQDWAAVRLVTETCELIVGISAGPRIVSFRRNGGANLLQPDTIDLRVGKWRRYGGHRFTVAPEESRSYEPDNAPCAAEMCGAELHVTAPLGAEGISRVLVIRAAADGAGFDLQHILENRGAQPWRGAPWAITCVPPNYPAVAPCAHAAPRFWPESENTGWQVKPGYVAVSPGQSRGKVGWHSAAGWLASLQPGATFVIHSPDIPARGECVDEGCNVEIYTAADCTELETLGGAVELAPGQNCVHRQRWRLLAPGFKSSDWAAIGAQAGCLASQPSLASHA